MDTMKSLFPYTVGDIPFFYSNLDSPSNGDGLPDVFPFVLDIDGDTGTVIQKYDVKIEQMLSSAYRKGSVINGCMDDTGIGRKYAQGFLQFIQKEVNGGTFTGKRILEIGCGTGYLLSLLKELGAIVVGIEPGKQAEVGSEKYQIPIIRDFYPSEYVQDEFDIIIVSSVLEHIHQPQQWLRLILGNLATAGQIFVSVPDCEPYMVAGDVSMFIHEHWSYFTADTLFHTLHKATGYTAHIEKAQFGTQLFGVLKGKIELKRSSHYLPVCDIMTQSVSLKKNIQKNMEAFIAVLNEEPQQSIGIYVPVRAMNLLTMLKGQFDLQRVRFFDDDPLLHGKFFPGINVRIESRRDLKEKPVDKLIIMSKTFGAKIVQELQMNARQSIRIVNFFDDGK